MLDVELSGGRCWVTNGRGCGVWAQREPLGRDLFIAREELLSRMDEISAIGFARVNFVVTARTPRATRCTDVRARCPIPRTDARGSVRA